MPVIAPVLTPLVYIASSLSAPLLQGREKLRKGLGPNDAPHPAVLPASACTSRKEAAQLQSGTGSSDVCIRCIGVQKFGAREAAVSSVSAIPIAELRVIYRNDVYGYLQVCRGDIPNVFTGV